MRKLVEVHTPYVSTVSKRVVAKFNKNVISLVDICDTAGNTREAQFQTLHVNMTCR